MSGKETVIYAKNLRLAIDGREILKGLDLDVSKGEFVGLIGPNGAGKTTLLKCLGGIHDAFRGDIKINGMDLKDMGSREMARHMAFMHQNTVITFPFPALEVVLMGRYPHLGPLKNESAEDYRIAREYMSYTGTDMLEAQPVTAMSGGEFQRVMFARVLTQETPILLLDEPTSNLDIAFEEQMFKMLLDLCGKGKTVVAAVHDLKTASRYCTRLVLMKEGGIVADGKVDDVLTSQNISEAYDVNALVYRNRVTGTPDFLIYKKEESVKQKTAHVIGGGGSASGVIRLLFERGYKITSGVLAEGDSDTFCAGIFGVECVTCMPYGKIDGESHRKNMDLVRNADITILCNMPFGPGNLLNLEAALAAEKLVIIEDGDPSGRDYTGGKALEIYNRLKENAIVVNQAALHEVL
jgi:iron complex transport system ATP-binding protein